MCLGLQSIENTVNGLLLQVMLGPLVLSKGDEQIGTCRLTANKDRVRDG